MRILPKWIGNWPAMLVLTLASVLSIAGCGGSTSSSGSNVTATPSFSPGGGTYSVSKTVTISDATANAVLYCTTDGTTPTTSSRVCSQPTTVSQTELLQAIAVAPGKSASAVASAGYVINLNAAPTPTFSPTGGAYAGSQSVTISDSLSGANIYYTLDGTTPTEKSTLYTNTILIAQSETLNAIAVTAGYDNSAVASAAYTINTALSAPTINNSNGLSPSSVTAGASAFTLTVNGTNFTSAATVLWNGTALTTTYVNATQLTAAVPASLVATASTPNVSVMTASGVSSAATFTITALTPSVTGVTQNGASVTAALMGSTVTINGTNFGSTQGTSIVAFGNVLATVKSWSATAITVTVPTDATAGSVNLVVTVGGVSSNAYALTLDSPTPVVNSISPTAAGVGQTVKISGNSFGTNEGAVSIGGAAVTTISKWIDTEIDVVVPSNAVSGDVIVTVNGNASATSSTTKFTLYPAPSITSLSETVMSIGDSVTITGVNYGSPQGTSKVTFDGVEATVSSWSDTQIVATVPTGATSGDVVVTVNSVASSGYAYTLAAAKLSGTVFSGTVASGKPIIGAAVEIYAAGIGGYATAGTSLGTATTGSDGSFTIGYQCPAASAGDELYLVATDGSITSGKTNGNLALMTALGSCNLSTFPSSSVIVNEVSTVASVYALAQFSTNAASGSHGILVGTSAGNTKGLSNAMLTVNNLYNSTTGTARAVTLSYDTFAKTHTCASAYASHVTACSSTNDTTYDAAENLNASYVPQARIHTLANLLNTCVSSADGSGCSGLISAATPSSTEPADTLQAILNIAQNPGANASSLYAVQSTYTTFTPELTATPTDWTIALTYTGGGLGASPASTGSYPATPVKTAIDADGGIWITIMGADVAGTRSIARFDNQGNALSPSATASNSYNGGLQPALNGTSLVPTGGIAFDTNGYMWIASPINSNQTIAKLDADGNAIAIYEGIGSWCAIASDLALDTTGHLWLGGVPLSSEWPCMGAINTSDGSAVDSAQDVSKVIPGNKANVINSIVIDPLGAVWGVAGNGTYPSVDAVPYLFTSSISGGKTPLSTVSAGTGNTLAYSIATDADGNLYAPSATAGGITKAATSAASFSTLNYSVPSGTAGVWTLAVDGAGHLWGAAYGGAAGSQVTVPSYLVEFDSNGNLLSPSNASSNLYGYTGTGGGGETHPILAEYSYADPFVGTAVDSSGNLWVTSGNPNDSTVQSNELVEFIGLAAPVRTPIAAALKNGEVGTRPLVRSSSSVSSVSKADRVN